MELAEDGKAEAGNYQGQQETRRVDGVGVCGASGGERFGISKPLGDSGRFDCVIGGPGKFVAVQVKCTIAKQQNAKGYICSLKSNNKKYLAGAFDFLAAYAILEDTWYIVPEKAIRGMGAICLCSTMPKYEQYREAWNLLREVSGCEESPFCQNQGEMGHPTVSDPEETPMGPAMVRMQGAMSFFRNYLEKGGAPR